MVAGHFLGRWKAKGLAFMDSLEVLARLLSFCTAFSKSTITVYWEVQMVLRLLGWKVDLISFPTMYNVEPETRHVGTEFHVK